MKKTLIYISFLSIFVLTIILGGIFSQRLDKEVLKTKRVVISPIDKNFIEADEILKMMNFDDSISGKIDIEKLENHLSKNKFVANVEVYKDLNANVYAYVQQYTPIARVIGKTSYYIDIEGKKRPLSKHYTENVMLVFGNLDNEAQKNVFGLLKKIKKDKILNRKIAEIHYINKDDYRLRLEGFKPVIKLGNLENIDDKFKKLKAIYAYIIQKNMKQKYAEIQLKYKNQIVCK